MKTQRPKNFGPSQIQSVYDPKENSKPGNIIERDLYFLNFPDKIDNLDLDILGKIRRQKFHYSPQFLKFLDTDILPAIIKYQKDKIIPGNLVPVEWPELLYRMYTDARQTDHINDEFPTDVPEILKVLLKQLKDGDYDPEKDVVDLPKNQQPDIHDNLPIADRPKIRQHFPSIVIALKKLLNIKDKDPEDFPDDLILDKIE